MKINKIINRRVNFDCGIWFTSSSFEEAGKWFNCLYIHYNKNKYPNIKHPEWVEKDPDISWDRGRFNYGNCTVAELDWHGGITFYEENTINGKETYIKAGCDFQHLYDGHYMTRDHGEEILSYAPKLLEEFLELTKQITKENL